MRMLGDCELFVQLCENHGIPASPEVLEAIKIGSATGELRLSCMSIVVPICEILSRMLASSSTIRKVDLSDCMLLSKGLSSILNALSEGSNIISLNLKGNNINGSTVGQLGKIFHQNHTLKHLSLEWNSIGTDIDEFSKFCEGLGANNNIEELDLRYNQISPHCAEALAKSLRTNKSLRTIDLSWNTLGLKGGKLLLNAMGENRSIVKMNLRGNCIPDEIVYAIDESIHKNQSRNLVSQAQIAESVSKIVIINEIVEKTSENDVNLLRNEPLEESSTVAPPGETPENHSERNNTRSNSNILQAILDEKQDKIIDACEAKSKIIELNKILQDRSSAIELLTREIATRTKETETSRNLVKQLENEIVILKKERETLGFEKNREIAEMRENRRKSDENWQREYKIMEMSLGEKSSREKELENRVLRYEREVRKNVGEIATLRDKMAEQTKSYEDLMAKSRVELHRARREIRERENRHKNELNILKNTLKESTEALEECQASLQKSRVELRENSENLSTVKIRLVDVERTNCRLSRIEENYEKLKDARKLIEEKCLDHERTIDTLQRQVATLKGELIEPQRRYDLVKDELEQEREKTARLRRELTEERTRLQEQNLLIQSLNSQITALNNQINEIQNNHVETLRERDKEKKILKDIIANKERDFNELKTEEVQRASQLYAAFSKYYLGSIGPNTTL